jgi:hypothetical protein
VAKGGHATYMIEMSTVYMILSVKHKRNSLPAKHRHGQGTIKIYLTETSCEDGNWIHLAQDRAHWQTLVYVAKKPLALVKVREFHVPLSDPQLIHSPVYFWNELTHYKTFLQIHPIVSAAQFTKNEFSATTFENVSKTAISLRLSACVI